MSYPVSADINSSGSNNLGTKINGQVGGNCNSGTCEITGGTVSGINLFHRFSSFDTRGDIQKVNFEIGSQNNVIVGVTANKGTFINKPISLSSQGNLYWVSPGGIRTGSGADFINVSQLTLSTATSVHFSSGGVFDVFGNNSLHLPSVSSDPLPGPLGLINDPDQRTANRITGTPKILLEGIDITVDKSLLVDSPDGTVEVINSRLVATSADNVAGSITITGNEVRIDGDSQLLATGNEQGGLIQIGGSWQNSNPTVRQAIKTTIEYGAFLDVSAIYSGNGGTIVAWSDITNLLSMTLVSGTLKARGGEYGGSGGRIETSGAHLRTEKVIVDTGEGGEWLLDPFNYTITDNSKPSFTSANIDASAAQVRGIHVADIDNDGDLDIVSAFYVDGTIAWYENDGNSNPNYTKNIVSTNAPGANDIYVADMDGDGDLDIISGNVGDDTISLFKNDGAADPSWTAANIANTANGTNSIHVGDIDNDGDLDIVAGIYGQTYIAWYENDGAANPSWATNNIATSLDNNNDVYLADIDKDGDLDIVSASGSYDTIAWYENDGAADPSWTAANITTSADGAEAVYVADIDSDGDLDIVSVESNIDTIAWYENDGNSNPSFNKQVVSNSADNGKSVYVGDLDNDGDLDIVSASLNDDTIAWYENDGAGDPSWTKADIDTNADGAFHVHVADTDRDGDLDIISASLFDKNITLHENNGAATWTPAFTKANIGSNLINTPVDIHHGDLDNDGDMDIVVVDYVRQRTQLSPASDFYTIHIYENDGAANPSFTKSTIPHTYAEGRRIAVADINRDGNLDIVVGGGGGYPLMGIIWLCNECGNHTWTPYQIDRGGLGGGGANDMRLADMDGDGDLDVIKAGDSNQAGFHWYENTGSYGVNTHWPKEILDSSEVPAPKAIDAGDIDNDGDLDFVSSYQNNGIRWYQQSQDHIMSWYKNDGAADPSWTESIVKTADRISSSRNNKIFDLDNDGDLDILSIIDGAEHGPYDGIAWYENDGAADPSFTENVIFSNVVSGNNSNAHGLEVGDLDNDGDLDFVITASSERGGISGTVTWFENNGATDPSWTQQSIEPFNAGSNHSAASFVDLDNDGDLDILSSKSRTLVWFENAGGYHFSSNNSSLENALKAGTSVTITTTSSSNSYVNSSNVSDGVGNITLNTNLDYTDGSGRLTLDAANAIEISNGYTLKSGSGGLELISSAGLTGSGSIIIDEDNASGDPSLTVEQSSNSTFSGSISGNGYFEKKGSGVLTLSANHTLTANDDIEAGQLIQPTTISIADVATSNENAANATFTVSLTEALARDISFNYATSNGTATAGSDYTSTSGSLTISAGQTSGTFNVPILADSTDENNETATLTLLNATNSTFSDDTATLTIADDDSAPTLSIADVTTSNETASNATFTVSLSQASARDISFNYATSNGTATAGSDYTSTSGSLTISAGQTSGTFNVPILADSTDENNETATLTLLNATNSTFSDDTATLTITDDDDASSTLAIDSSSIEAIKNRPLSSSVPCPKCGNIHEGECLSSDRNKNKRKISTRPFNEVAKGLNNIHLFSKIIESTFQFPEKKKM